jgi:phospholipase C
MMENHSYDNYLGMLRRPGADGFRIGRNGLPVNTNPYADGDVQHAFRMPTHCQTTSVTQEWVASHEQYEGGAMNGFVTTGGAEAMGYWDSSDLPFYYSLASTFPLADRYFCSVLGQTYPNRRYLFAATSLGMVDDVVAEVSAVPPNGTIFDRLNLLGLSWLDYYSDTPSTLLYPDIVTGNPGKIVSVSRFFTDAAAGTLPAFSLVEPRYTQTSEEDPQDIARGEAFAASVVNAVMTGPDWGSTLLVWTYDEHGGYYDHVPPPRAIPPDAIGPLVPADEAYDGFGRYGFRVPAVVVSPFARRGHVSHTVYDHTSICALVEHKWNMPAMTYRDANADPMLGMLDLTRRDFAEPPRLASPVLTTDPSVTGCETSGAGTIPPPGSVTPPGRS